MMAATEWRKPLWGAVRGAIVAVALTAPLAFLNLRIHPIEAAMLWRLVQAVIVWGACCGLVAAVWARGSLPRAVFTWITGTFAAAGVFTLMPSWPGSIRFTLEFAIWPWLVGFELLAWGVGLALLDAALQGFAASRREPWMHVRLLRGALIGGSVGAVYAIGTSAWFMVMDPGLTLSLGGNVFEVGLVNMLRRLVLCFGLAGAAAGLLTVAVWRVSLSYPYLVSLALVAGECVYGLFVVKASCLAPQLLGLALIMRSVYWTEPDRAAFLGLTLGSAFALIAWRTRLFASEARFPDPPAHAGDTRGTVALGLLLSAVLTASVVVIWTRATRLPVELVRQGRATLTVVERDRSEALCGFAFDSRRLWILRQGGSARVKGLSSFFLTGVPGTRGVDMGEQSRSGINTKFKLTSNDALDPRTGHFVKSIPGMSDKIEIRDLRDGRLVGKVAGPFYRCQHLMIRGNYVFIGNGSVTNWRTGKITRLQGAETDETANKFSLAPNGLTIAGPTGNRLAVWSCETGKVIQGTLDRLPRGRVLDFTDNFIVVEGKASELFLFDLSSRTSREYPPHPFENPYETRVSPDGNWLCSRGSGVQIFTPADSRPYASISQVDDRAWVAIGDGVFNASATARTGDVVIQYADLTVPLNPHNSPLRDPNFFPEVTAP